MSFAPDRTNAKRQAALRQREEAAGLKRRLVLVPVERITELEEICRRWRDEATNVNVAEVDTGHQ